MNRRAIVLVLAAVASVAAPAFAAAPAGVTVLLEAKADEDIGFDLGPAGTWAERCAFVFTRAQPENVTRSVSLWCPGETGAVAALRPLTGLGDEVFAVDTRRSPQGGVDLLVGAQGEVRLFLLVDPDAEPAAGPVLRDARLGPWTLEDPDLDGDGTADLVQVVSTGLAAWRRTPDGFTAWRDVALPPRANFDRDSVSVFSPGLISDDKSGTRWTTADLRPGNRWRTFRIDLSGDGSVCPAYVEPGGAWRVASSTVVAGGDKEAPRLVALAQPADRLALMNELRLVVAPLACRASGKGSAPEVFVETAFPNHSNPWLTAEDMTGDGTLDIVARGIKGRLSPDIQVAVWRGLGGGLFEKKPLTLVHAVKDLGAFDIQADVDGDGRKDLRYAGKDGPAYCRGIPPDGVKVPFACDRPVRYATPPKDYDTSGLGVTLAAGSRRVLLIRATTKKDKKDVEVLLAVEQPGARP